MAANGWFLVTGREDSLQVRNRCRMEKTHTAAPAHLKA
jgi:hypothetical protein